MDWRGWESDGNTSDKEKGRAEDDGDRLTTPRPS